MPVPDWEKIWGDTVEIIANSGIQFLDFDFKLQDVKGFTCELAEVISEEGIQSLVKPSAEKSEDILYEFTARELIQLYENKWMPVPFFSRGGPFSGLGPFNWTRIRFIKASKDHFLVQLAIDTTINAEDHEPDGEDLSYQQPSLQDADVAREFSFSSSLEQASILLKDGCDDYETFQYEDGGAWASDWVLENYAQLDEDEIRLHPESKLEAWGSYLALMEFFSQAISLPKLKIKSSQYSSSDPVTKIDVDLVLDIGNSRTCGLLVEIPQGDGQASLDMDAVSQLRLKDLSEPSIEYGGLFESRVEFADLNFGRDDFSRASGRNNAFMWPSFVRFGPEAIRLVSRDTGNEAFSGLSSPKRYLWDNSPFEHRWRFHNWENEQRSPRSLAAMLPKLTPLGESIEQIKEDRIRKLRTDYHNPSDTALHAEFSKSSLYGFMIIEIIAQAFRQINDAQYRGNKKRKNTPRSLRNVIITLPTATPKQEQAIIKSKVRGAIKLLWGRMATSGQVRMNTQPEITVEWDEASCSQVMFLYSEIMHKYYGAMTDFLKVFGKNRSLPKETEEEIDEGLAPAENIAKSIKIACVDIGGGTTDLMVTTFYQQHDVELTPVQNFREGFRRAGDDLLCNIIQSLVIPKIKENLVNENGFSSDLVESALMTHLGKSVAGNTAAQRHQQRQFTIKILAPLALEILNANFKSSNICAVEYNDIPDITAADEVNNYLDDGINSVVKGTWSIKNLTITFTEAELTGIIEDCFIHIFENISEIISHENVDCVLLTGRPSQNDLIIDLFKKCCPVNPDRIYSMSKYNTGPWYPFRSPKNTVGDPKSSVAVGAMLIALAGSRRLIDFYIPKKKFQMRPTDLFIGKYNKIGKIDEENVYFSADNPEKDTVELKMMTDTFIGSRQMKVARWVATPLYKLYFSDVSDEAVPYTVTLTRRQISDDSLDEPIKVQQAYDSNGKPKRENVKLKLQTLGSSEEYWLDSGAFDI